MENPVQNSPALLPQSKLCIVGMGWFPNRPGGLNRYVYDLTHTLAQQGNYVELCATDVPNDSSIANLELIHLADSQASLIQRWQSARHNFAQRHRPQVDAVNLHFSLYSFPVLSQLPQDCPITFTFHGPWADESQREGSNLLGVFGKKWLEQRVYQRCDQFIVLSQAFGEILHRRYHVPWEKIQRIPGGINLTRFQANLTRRQARNLLGFPLDRPVLFTPRRLVQRMGIDKLLDALVVIKRQVPEVWLAIAGKGSQRSTLERQVQDLNLTDHVKFLGYVPDDQLPLCYQAADLTVVPSQMLEGFGLILLESLACGTPVLATPVGGMPEILQPFCPQLLTTDTSTGSISARIIELLCNLSLLPDRQACREYATTHFDWEMIAPQILQSLLL
ncbi:glycosyltransferase family 4 protein [filamentous cyanobacterium LEGE 11480]|uniref:Glycosyltransferase family 4 protein n=1 Tax=Romeriopsis navalis LEGE 11480 TaxID=2777977 RepID=A0A928VN33_9CYAN|nr:glycosyltransferase family 4 protein [Romeriopsis navalis]MBE9029530.1 glycosyltransferase family 4 protein [Romeriopsis navalis LEGE 11480]